MSPARLLILGASLAACSSSSTGTTSQDAGSVAVAPARCGFAPVFPARDAGTGSCLAARYALSCSVSSIGAAALCVSDDPARCDTGTAETSGCVSQCAASEYAAACGGAVGDAGTTEPPSTCRLLAPLPGGHPFYCCTCE